MNWSLSIAGWNTGSSQVVILTSPREMLAPKHKIKDKIRNYSKLLTECPIGIHYFFYLKSQNFIQLIFFCFCICAFDYFDWLFIYDREITYLYFNSKPIIISKKNRRIKNYDSRSLDPLLYFWTLFSLDLLYPLFYAFGEGFDQLFLSI